MSDKQWPQGCKKYRLEVDTFGMPTVDMDVEIDFDRLSEDQAKEHILFWMDGESLIREEDGNIHAAFMKQLFHFAISFALLNDYNAHGVTECFKEEEGWCLDDGVVVFTGSSVEWRPDYSDMEITEVAK